MPGAEDGVILLLPTPDRFSVALVTDEGWVSLVLIFERFEALRRGGGDMEALRFLANLSNSMALRLRAKIPWLKAGEVIISLPDEICDCPGSEVLEGLPSSLTRSIVGIDEFLEGFGVEPAA